MIDNISKCKLITLKDFSDDRGSITFVEYGMRSIPKSANKIPIIKVFPVPNLSAIIPPNGDIAPTTS